MKKSFCVGDTVMLQYFNGGFRFGDTGDMDGKIGTIKRISSTMIDVKLSNRDSIVSVIPEECIVMGTTSGAKSFEFDVDEQVPSPKEIIVPTNKTITLLSSSTTLKINQNF